MYVGVGTHKKTHTLVAIDEDGRTYGSRTIANTPEGWAAVLEWRRSFGDGCVWGAENSGSLGKGLAQFLLGHGEEHGREIAPHRTAQYRGRGRSQDKSDTADALAMARLPRAEGEQLPQVRQDDLSTELRLLSDHPNNLVVDRTGLINQLHAQMLQPDPSYQEKSGPLTHRKGATYRLELEPTESCPIAETRLMIVRRPAQRILELHDEIAEVTKLLGQRVRDSGTPLLEMSGIGEVVAARMIGELGLRPRIHSAAALAALAGVAPLQVSSGGRHGRRVNLGGNRQLNRKKRAEGKTQRAAMRCLKRQLVDVLYRLLQRGNMESVIQKAVVLYCPVPGWWSTGPSTRRGMEPGASGQCLRGLLNLAVGSAPRLCAIPTPVPPHISLRSADRLLPLPCESRGER